MFLKAKINCNELYELLVTYEGIMGNSVYYSEHVPGSAALPQMNIKE